MISIHIWLKASLVNHCVQQNFSRIQNRIQTKPTNLQNWLGSRQDTSVNLPQARGQSKAENKVSLLAHCLQLEHKNLFNARDETIGFLVDQCSAERKIKKHAYGSLEEVKEVAHLVASKLLNLSDERARRVIFLPNCIEQPAIFHVLYNPLEEAFTSLSGWDVYVTQLRAICKSIGDSSYKELQLATTFKD